MVCGNKLASEQILEPVDVSKTAALDDSRFKGPMRWLKAANFRKTYLDLAQT
jgi:hypothetical protein